MCTMFPATILQTGENPKVINMVMLGAFVEVTKCVDVENIVAALSHKLGAKKADLIPLNREALKKGARPHGYKVTVFRGVRVFLSHIFYIYEPIRCAKKNNHPLADRIRPYIR